MMLLSKVNIYYILILILITHSKSYLYLNIGAFRFSSSTYVRILMHLDLSSSTIFCEIRHEILSAKNRLIFFIDQLSR